MRRRATAVGVVLVVLAAGLVGAGKATAASPSPDSVNFGNVPLNSSVTSTITLTIDDGYKASVATSGLNPPFSFDFDACGAGGGFVGPGTCTVKETFTPTAAGAASDTLTVLECPVAGGTCVAMSVPLQGVGVLAASANPPSVNFGNVGINTTVTQTVTLTIDAGYKASVASGGLNPPFSFDFDACGAGGGFTGPGTCTIKESFDPTTAGAASDTLNVFECPVGGGSCIGIPVPLSGTGVTAASANPPSIDFGNVGIDTTVTHGVAVTIDGGYRASVASGSGLNPPFGFNFDTCGASGGFTGPGTCNVNESFSPTAAGAASGTLNVFECPVAGGSCIGIPVALQGNGVVEASANPPSVNFGNVGINTTATQAVTLTIDAGYRASVASGSGLNPPFGFDFSVCGASGGFTGPGTCTINERFSPTAAGAASGTLNVFECPVAGGTCIGIPVPVSGTGVVEASANPPSVNFGNVPLHATVTQPVTLTIDAGYRASVASGSGLNPPFSFDFGVCGAGGGFTGPGTCTINESFAPDRARTGERHAERVRVPGGGRHVHRHSRVAAGQRRQRGVRQPAEPELRQRPDQHDGDPARHVDDRHGLSRGGRLGERAQPAVLVRL